MQGSDFENDERVGVLVARGVRTTDGAKLAFVDAWERRTRIALADGTGAPLPCLADLMLTKRFASRPKDLEDARLLQAMIDGVPESRRGRQP